MFAKKKGQIIIEDDDEDHSPAKTEPRPLRMTPDTWFRLKFLSIRNRTPMSCLVEGFIDQAYEDAMKKPATTDTRIKSQIKHHALMFLEKYRRLPKDVSMPDTKE